MALKHARAIELLVGRKDTKIQDWEYLSGSRHWGPKWVHQQPRLHPSQRPSNRKVLIRDQVEVTPRAPSDLFFAVLKWVQVNQ